MRATRVVCTQSMKIWGIRYKYTHTHTRVFLFGLFLQRTNLMNPSIELGQLVLSYLYITYITWCLISCSCVYAHDTIFNTCLFKSVLSIHLGFSEHATWIHFTYSLGCFLTTPEPACPDLGASAFSLLLIRVVQQKRRSLVDHPESFLPAFPSRLSRFSFAAHEHLSVFTLCISLCKSYFASLGDIIFI